MTGPLQPWQGACSDIRDLLRAEEGDEPVQRQAHGRVLRAPAVDCAERRERRAAARLGGGEYDRS